jgi:hypothetical protein
MNVCIERMERQLESSKCQEKKRLKDSEDRTLNTMGTGLVLIVLDMGQKSKWYIQITLHDTVSYSNRIP